VYDRKEEPYGVRLVLSIDSIRHPAGRAALETLQRCGTGRLLPTRSQARSEDLGGEKRRG
jgi:hypothetical protein